MPAVQRQLFIYYRVAAGRADEAITAAALMQRGLRERHPGLAATLLRRPHAENDHVTLMETYAMDAAAAPAGVSEALQADIEAQAQAALAAWTVGARHVEVFVDCGRPHAAVGPEAGEA